MSTIDVHVAGAPVRVVVSGWPAARGTTMADRQRWLERQVGPLRRSLLSEPRGHEGLLGAVLTEPVSPASHAGLLAMTHAGYRPFCGASVVAMTTVALERGLISVPASADPRLQFDVIGGTVTARAVTHPLEATRGDEQPSAPVASPVVPAPVHVPGRVLRVKYQGPPAAVVLAGLAITSAGRTVRADVVHAGGVFLLVDGESMGVPLTWAARSDILRAARRLLADVDRRVLAARVGDRRAEPAAIVLTGPAEPPVHLRSATVTTDGLLDASPSVDGSVAVAAVLSAMGLGTDREPIVHEGLLGGRVHVRTAGHGTPGEWPAVDVEVEATAWVTGEHTFLFDETDPLRDGPGEG